MTTRNFSFDEARLPLRGVVHIVGRNGAVATNDQQLLEILSKAYTLERGGNHAFAMEILVHEECRPRNHLPHFRGLHHLVFASFGQADVFVFDIAARSIRGAMTAALAHDPKFWRESLLPIAMGVFGASIGVLPLHAACLSLNSKGVLIAGVSGTGKSTLALALAKDGAGFISDDWTYLTYDHQVLQARGLSSPIKLLPDATRYFAELRKYEPHISLNGELAYELPGNTLGLRVEGHCTPDCLVFYERVSNGEASLMPLSGEEARQYIHSSIEPVPPQLSWIEEYRDRVASRVTELPCWRFRHSGDPHAAAHSLKTYLVRQEARVGS